MKMAEIPFSETQGIRFIKSAILGAVVGLSYGGMMRVSGSGWLFVIYFNLLLGFFYSLITQGVKRWSLRPSLRCWRCFAYALFSAIIIGFGFLVAYDLLLRIVSDKYFDEVLLKRRPPFPFGPLSSRFSTMGFAVLLSFTATLIGLVQAVKRLFGKRDVIEPRG